MTRPGAPPDGWRIAAAAATTELLVARASGDALDVADIGVAALLAGALAASKRPLLPLLVYAVGLLVPALWGRGTGLVVWVLLAAAVAIAARRGSIGARGTVAGLAACVGVVWLVVAVGEGQPPPPETAARVGGALLALLLLGRHAFLLAPLAFWPGAAERWSATGAVPTGPDIVIVSVDTLRLDAARGMRVFEGTTLLEAQAPAPWTLPSLATLQTGLLPGNHGAVRVATGFAPTRAATLAERFAAAGYDTAATVESPFAGERFGLQRGFAVVRADGARPWVLPRAPFGDRARPAAALALAALGVLHGDDGGVHRRVRDVLDFLEMRRERPLFVWVHVLDAHLPYRHAPDLDLSWTTRAWLATAHRVAIGPTPNTETLALLARAYAHEVTTVDAALVALRDRIPGAVLVLTSDHGEEFGEHGGFEHGHTFHQELLAIPLAFSGVSLVADGPVGLQDVAPTLLGAAGLPADGLDGRDLRVPGTARLPSVNLLYGPLDARAVRVGARTVIAHEDTVGYALDTDPGERTPLPPFDDLVPLLPRPPSGTAAVSLDRDATDALRALGYVE